MERKPRNVLVIGNGFDLAHDLKTSYTDFIDWVKAFEENYSGLVHDGDETFIERIGENGFVNFFCRYTDAVPGWVDLERLIKKITGYFMLFFNNYMSVIDSSECLTINYLDSNVSSSGMLQIKTCLLEFPLYDKDYSNSRVISKHLASKYFSIYYGLNKAEILKLLKSQLDDLIKLLHVYLRNYMPQLSKEVKPLAQIANIHPDYLISFNYTDTYKLYGIKAEDVFHVHGSIENGNMVLGYDDDNEKELDFVYFKKYFQRIQKLTGYIDSDKMMDNDNLYGGLPPVIHFYGHSLDKTDGDMLKSLREMAQGFVIYKYSQNDFEQKVVNLIEVFGKERTLDMIQRGYIKFVPCSKDVCK